MYYAYLITNTVNNKVYVGITKNIPNRWRSHKYQAKKSRVKSSLYLAMNKYGFHSFNIEEIASFESSDECCEFEINSINFLRENNIPNYNLHDGGTIGYSMSGDERYEEWKQKLSIARQGRKPALGMKHTEDNKQLFSDVSNKYWSTQDVYDIEAIVKLSFKEAHSYYGISKTHYYRLRRGSSSDSV